MDNTDRGNKPDDADSDPRPAAVTFVTTEHFTLQGARAQTVSESTGRASVFLGAVSGGLIALGLDIQRVRATIPEDQRDAHLGLERVEEDLQSVLADLRELSRGLHPPLLSRRGLRPALRALARD